MDDVREGQQQAGAESPDALLDALVSSVDEAGLGSLMTRSAGSFVNAKTEFAFQARHTRLRCLVLALVTFGSGVTMLCDAVVQMHSPDADDFKLTPLQGVFATVAQLFIAAICLHAAWRGTTAHRWWQLTNEWWWRLVMITLIATFVYLKVYTSGMHPPLGDMALSALSTMLAPSLMMLTVSCCTLGLGVVWKTVLEGNVYHSRLAVLTIHC